MPRNNVQRNGEIITQRKQTNVGKQIYGQKSRDGENSQAERKKETRGRYIPVIVPIKPHEISFFRGLVLVINGSLERRNAVKRHRNDRDEK